MQKLGTDNNSVYVINLKYAVTFFQYNNPYLSSHNGVNDTVLLGRWQLNNQKTKHWLINLVNYLLFICVLGVSLLGVISSWFGWNLYLELLSHFQVQYFIIGSLILFFLGLTHHFRLFIIGVFLIALNSPKIIPWYLPSSALFSSNESQLKVLVANVNTRNKNYDQVLSLVREEAPDLSIFIEVDETWVQQLDSLKDILSYTFGKANPYDSGLIVYSSQPLINPQLSFFGSEERASVIGTLTVNEQLVDIIATHPPPPLRPDLFNLRNRQLDDISNYVQNLSHPVLLVGDLNITMWSPYYQRLEKKTGLKNARMGWGILPSWPTQSDLSPLPSWASKLLSIPIDHCLISKEFKVVDTYTGSDVGSDHLPLITKLKIE